MLTVEERFWQKVRVAGPDDCWEWLGHIDRRGYGSCYFPNSHPRKNGVAHRYLYEVLLGKGPLPEHMSIDHLCQNKRCVNPAHLEVVTMRENILRGNGKAANNARKTHCPNGHPYNLLNTYFRDGGRRRNCRICWQQQFRSR